MFLKDVENYIEKEMSCRLGNGDVVALNNMLVKIQQTSSNFFSAIDTDENGKIRNIFWVDGRSRATYKDFHDGMSFESMYLLNKYNMPFPAFVGANHHMQSILISYAFVSDQEVKNCEWVFDTCLKCIDNQAANAIVIDQRKSMRRAI